MIAAWRGHSSIVAELVREAGAQIDARDQVYNLYALLCLVFWYNPRFIACIICTSLEAPREYRHEASKVYVN